MSEKRTGLVVYGSETGNSEDVAFDLSCLLERLHFSTRVSEMNAVEVGEFPKNSLKFWRSLLRKSLPPGYLSHVSFATFGLGDSSYPKFNISSRKLNKRLLQLGASEVCAAGEADDQHPEGIDGTYLSWSHDLQKHLLAVFPLPEGSTPLPSEVFLPPKYYLEIDQGFIQISPSTQDIHHTEDEPIPHWSEEIDMNLPSYSAESQLRSGAENFWITKSEAPTPSVECEKLKENHATTDLQTDTTLPPSHEHIPIPDSFNAILKANTRMTPHDHFQDVREILFIFKGDIIYEPGDSIIIYPKNFPEDVDLLINLMDWQLVADKPLKFQPEHPDYYGDEWLVTAAPNLHPIPHSTLRQLLTHNLDITAVPKRRFFELIAHYTDNPTHQERLREFANPIFTDEFYDYTSRPRRSILEVLNDFPSVRLPWRYITSIIPVMRGRAYSIASGGAQRLMLRKSGVFTTLTILVAIVKYRTVLKRIRRGLCSRYLSSLKENTTIKIEFQKSNNFYKLARIAPQLPLILVAPGTGIAPCRSLIFERENLQFGSGGLEKNIKVGFNFLFFGGRNRRADFFYEHDWTAENMQTSVYPVFSRDQREKIYVQDMILREAQLVATLILRDEAIIYVCGSSGNMPKGVKDAFISVLVSCDEDLLLSGVPFTRETAMQKLDEMARSGNYVQETW